VQAVKVLNPLNGDQAIADLYCQKNGRPFSEREWICQHSCAPERIPDCKDVNCEGTTITNRGDLSVVCSMIAQGGPELLADLPVKVDLAIDAPLAAALSPLAALLKVRVVQDSDGYMASGSLLDFARLTPLRVDMNAGGELHDLLAGIESTLAWHFDPVGSALFRQRFADLRRHRHDRGNALLFLAYDPQPLVVAWEAPRTRNRKPAPLPEVPVANLGFGIVTGSEGVRLTFTGRHLVSVPGDYHGPQLRAFFRVDQNIVDATQAWCEACEKTPDSASPDQRFSALLSRITTHAGISAPPLRSDFDSPRSFVRTRRFLSNLLLSQPLPDASTHRG
jgi:hypothetical protein